MFIVILYYIILKLCFFPQEFYFLTYVIIDVVMCIDIDAALAHVLCTDWKLTTETEN